MLRISDRVCLHGLRYKSELNDREGTVLEIWPLRVSVRLDAQDGAPGTDLIVMLENVRMLQVVDKEATEEQNCNPDYSEKAPSIKQKRKQKRKQNRLVQPWTTVARRQLDFDSANTQFVQF